MLSSEGMLSYRDYDASYLNGVGNDFPVYRASGNDAGKLIFKNKFSFELTRLYSNPPTPVCLYRVKKYNGSSWDDWEWYMFDIELGDSFDSSGNHLVPYPWNIPKTISVEVAPHEAPWITYYREEDILSGHYSNGKADGGVPIGNRVKNQYAVPDNERWGPKMSLGDFYLSGDSYDPAGFISYPYGDYILIYPWWGVNHATSTYNFNTEKLIDDPTATSELDRIKLLTVSNINQPEGRWAFVCRMYFGQNMCFPVFVSDVQHKSNYNIPTRESLIFRYSHSAKDYVSFRNGDYMQYVDATTLQIWNSYASKRDAFLSALSFELKAIPR